MSLRISLLTAFILFAPTSAAIAAEKHPFSAGPFHAAQTAGRPILVDVQAPWCPVCKKQQVILDEIESDPKFRGLHVFNVDFDSQKSILKSLGVSQQSTLIIFKGGREVARSVGATNREVITSLIDRAL